LNFGVCGVKRIVTRLKSNNLHLKEKMDAKRDPEQYPRRNVTHKQPTIEELDVIEHRNALCWGFSLFIGTTFGWSLTILIKKGLESRCKECDDVHRCDIAIHFFSMATFLFFLLQCVVAGSLMLNGKSGILFQDMKTLKSPVCYGSIITVYGLIYLAYISLK
jgi:hypothetical protein